MRADLRRKEIVELLQTQHQFTVAALAERFDVSLMTIRRDLDALEERCMLRRERGYAVYSARYVDAPGYDRRLLSNVEAKKRIAEKALPFLAGLNSIYVDGSTTCRALIEALPPDCAIKVYTNSIPAASIIADKPCAEAFMFGGALVSSMRHLDCASPNLGVNDIYVDAAFISCSGYNEKRVINYDVLTVNERRLMLKNAHARYLLADSQKCGKTGVFTVCEWSDIDVFVTDAEPDEHIKAALKAGGVRLVY